MFFSGGFREGIPHIQIAGEFRDEPANAHVNPKH
jgi:hypothetical protein